MLGRGRNGSMDLIILIGVFVLGFFGGFVVSAVFSARRIKELWRAL